ncbi:ORF6N domain-containing protein [Duganella sp. CF517]|uniref:ORF6N domain-containing protein n=1 Tax=Duganella sp. CF517 TaxID=1881038 RepID=UPI0008D0BDD0|nr:ORF6N domain-containing protein [Duganella sp. CF517]SEN31834.1 ORF6N domain-containing protein [Duganella sp. CF517]
MSARPPYELLLAAQQSAPAAPVEIAGVQLVPIEYAGVRVLTLAMMDKAHRRPDGTAGRNFRENRARLVEGEDFMEIDQPDEIRRLGFTRPQGGTPASMLLLTETGYSMLVKSFTDDLAWDVQRQLVKSYFAKHAPAADPLACLPPEQRALVDLMFEQAAMKQRLDTQGAALTTVEQRVDEIAAGQVLLTRPSAAESIVHIRIRIGKLYGLPARIVDEVVRQSPYALKPVMVKNAHADALGGSYACFWIKDVSAVFARFAGECQRVTATQATHPFIEGRFKLTPQSAAGPGGQLPLIGG